MIIDVLIFLAVCIAGLLLCLWQERRRNRRQVAARDSAAVTCRTDLKKVEEKAWDDILVTHADVRRRFVIEPSIWSDFLPHNMPCPTTGEAHAWGEPELTAEVMAWSPTNLVRPYWHEVCTGCKIDRRCAPPARVHAVDTLGARMDYATVQRVRRALDAGIPPKVVAQAFNTIADCEGRLP